MIKLKQDVESDDEQVGQVEKDEPDAPDGLAATDDFVDLKGNITVPGVIYDPFSGKTWALPTGALEDVVVHNSPYAIKKDPNFHYQAACFSGPGGDEVSDLEAKDFVKVTRKELGFGERIKQEGDIATPMDNYYTINGEQVMMKIPKIIADRRYAALKKMADAARDACVPPEKVNSGATERLSKDKLAGLEVDHELYEKHGLTEI